MPPSTGDIKNLVKTSRSGNTFATFIFEPKDLVPFETAWEWQRTWQQGLLGTVEAPQAIWILQHTECYTLGRNGDSSNLFFQPEQSPSPLHRIDRGGEVTCHLPGQLIAYLVLDLHRYKTDLDWYLRELESTILDVLLQLGLKGNITKGITGVWLSGKKVASIGISGKRWITQHGLALNVNCDLQGFSKIIPCGLRNCSVGRLDSFLPGLTIAEVQPLLRDSLSRRFDLDRIN
tara:strand:+ start:3265 stop:3963 length:699 start_codon:yes stop_codon:yes gene_type:complete